MNKEEIAKLKEKMKEFESKDIFIKIEGAIQYYTTIYNAKIIISQQKLIISDQKEQDFIIELFYLENVKIEGNAVCMELSNDINIILDW